MRREARRARAGRAVQIFFAGRGKKQGVTARGHLCREQGLLAWASLLLSGRAEWAPLAESSNEGHEISEQG